MPEPVEVRLERLEKLAIHQGDIIARLRDKLAQMEAPKTVAGRWVP